MNFEQLLDGATKGPWVRDGICVQAPDGNVGIVNLARYSETDAEYIARLSPDVMREVWAALKEADNALKDYIPDLEARGASLNYGRSVLRKLDRALALLDGQTEDNP